MSSRALRKMQKHQELLQQHNDSNEEDESEVENPPKQQALNTFDMLVGTSDAQDDEAESADLSDRDDAHTEATKDHNIKPSSSTRAKQNKARKRKKKSKPEKDGSTGKTHLGNKGKQVEIDPALKTTDMDMRDGSDDPISVTIKETHLDVCELLGVNSKQLNALNEMKRLFGNVVLEADGEGSNSPGHGRRRGRVPQHLDLGEAFAGRHSPVSNGHGLAGLALRRNVFMAGKEEWPKATSGGLGMEVFKTRANGITEYCFVHSTTYQDTQSQFATCVESMDPQRMIQMLHFNRKTLSSKDDSQLIHIKAYHISTLLQVSEIAKQQGDHSVSGDLLERALFTFGRSVHSSFTAALSEGKVRLDFRRPENREFWLAAWRYIINLGQRGTWRTAYEWAKLLLSLDPEGDPFCVGLVLDQLALRAGQSAHFLKLSSSSLYHGMWKFRPNIQISSALAEYKTKQVSNATDKLRGDVSKFPWIFARLFQVLNIDKIPGSIWGKAPRSDRERFDCEMYIHGSKDLWNTPQTIALLVEAATTATSDNIPEHVNPITQNEARHVFLSGEPALLSLVPRQFTSMTANSSDPLPPDDNLLSYLIVSRPEAQEDFGELFPDFDEDLNDLEDLPTSSARLNLEDSDESHSENQVEGRETQNLHSFWSRLIPWLDSARDRSGSEPPPPELGIPAANPTTNQERRATQESVNEFLLRTMNPDIIPARFRHLWRPYPEVETTAADASNQEPPNSDATTNNPAPPNPSTSPPPSHAQPDSPVEPIPQEPYNDERNQRWLAGQGLIRLRDFITTHGVDDTAWSPAEIEAEGREVVYQYARRVLQLQQRTRNFIVDYVLKQGTSGEVRALVLREVERIRGGL